MRTGCKEVLAAPDQFAVDESNVLIEVDFGRRQCLCVRSTAFCMKGAFLQTQVGSIVEKERGCPRGSGSTDNWVFLLIR